MILELLLITDVSICKLSNSILSLNIIIVSHKDMHAKVK